MAAPERVQLGAAMLNRQWWIDINTGTYDAPTWTPVNGHTEFTPSFETGMQDDSDMDTLTGATSEIATTSTWGIETKLVRKVTAASPTVYDPGQEAIRTAGKEVGYDNVVDVRFYEMNIDSAGSVTGPTTEAYRGNAAVSWSPDGGGMDALSSVTVKLSGRGDRITITHPEGAAAAAPVLSALAPYTGAAAGGNLVVITGSNFTGTLASGSEGIMFGTVECTVFTVHSDNMITALAPSGTGTVAVSVENATGISTTTQNYIYT